MMSAALADLLIFAAISILGWRLISLLARAFHRRPKFSLINYLLFIAGPVIAVGFAWYRIGAPVLYIFGLSMGIGMYFEFKIDQTWAYLMGQRLWKYYRLNISSNTSWLVLPIWGCGGVLFMLISRLFLNSGS